MIKFFLFWISWTGKWRSDNVRILGRKHKHFKFNGNIFFMIFLLFSFDLMKLCKWNCSQFDLILSLDGSYRATISIQFDTSANQSTKYQGRVHHFRSSAPIGSTQDSVSLHLSFNFKLIKYNTIFSVYCSNSGKYDLQKLHEANQDKCKRYGPIVREEFQAGHSVIHLFDPNDFETLFRSQGPTPIRPANEFVCHYRAKHPDKYANAGIAHLQGEQWAEQRRLMGPAMLRLGVLDSYLPQLNCITDELIDCIRTGHRIENHIDIEDVQNLTYKLALESVCSLTLDTRIHCFDEEHITSDGQVLVEATKRLFDAYQRLYYAAPWWKLYQTRDFKQLGESESIIYQTAGRYIQNAMDLLDQESELSVKRPSLLRTLVQIKDLDRRDIHTLILDFIAGGINTTSNALAVALHHLASNPEKQENLFNELDRLFPEHRTNGQVTVKSNRLNKSKYLRACLKETFRLDSPIPCVVRTLSTDLHLSGYFIPKGVSDWLKIKTVKLTRVLSRRPRFLLTCTLFAVRKIIFRIRFNMNLKDG